MLDIVAFGTTIGVRSLYMAQVYKLKCIYFA